MHALLVEDDPLTRRMLEQALAARGHAVDAFAEASPALERYRERGHPLCVLDWVLPGMDGLALCRAIRKLPQGEDSVILVITGCHSAEDLGEILDAGASDYLAKPVGLDLFEVRLAVAERHAEQLAERRRAADALRAAHKLEGLGALAGGIAHDFNNLLVGVLGNAGLALMDVPQGSAASEALRQIEVSAKRAADLCMQLLAYSGRGRLFVERVDLNALVQGSRELIEAAVRGQATLGLDLCDRVPAVEADQNQLRQAIVNLVLNAAEAIEGGGGRVVLRTGAMEADRPYLAGAQVDDGLAPGRYAFLEVEDDGCGIEAEVRRRLFDPFFSTKYTGRGLGLASVLGVVRSHRGAIRLDSQPGRGTTVRILLPPAPGQPEATADHGPTPPPRPRVLLVDDEPGVRDVTARLLAVLGFDCATAADGEEAVEVFRARRRWVDVVLLDLAMPRLSGDRAFHAIRALDPAARVVLMSGYGEDEVARRMSGAGIAGFLQKPFTPQDLQRVLRAALEKGGPAAR